MSLTEDDGILSHNVVKGLTLQYSICDSERV